MESSTVHPHFAGFWSRAAARIIDLLIIIVAINLIYQVDQLGAGAGLWTGMEPGEGSGAGIGFSMTNALRGLFFLTFPGFYFVYLHGTYGQTIGKMIFHISVVNSDGSHIDYRKALLRLLMEIFLNLILGFLIIITASIIGALIAFLFSTIGLLGRFLKTVYDYIAIIVFLILSPCPVFLWAAFDPRRQGLHDRMCKTIVIWTGVPSPPPVTVAPKPEVPAEAPPGDPSSLDTFAPPPL
jgi:uncharacterized RDD family membrane protein YckC